MGTYVSRNAAGRGPRRSRVRALLTIPLAAAAVVAVFVLVGALPVPGVPDGGLLDGGSAAMADEVPADETRAASRSGTVWSMVSVSRRRAAARAGSGPATATVPTGVALTIDDGPDPRHTPAVLDLLRELDVRAVFCVVGTEAERHPELVRRIAAEGHALCNHTWTHDLALPMRSAEGIARELERTSAVIEEITGDRPLYFRAPGGHWSAEVLAVSRAAGMAPIGWSVDTRDWMRPGRAAIVTALLMAGDGAVVLCHDGGGDRSATVAALAEALPVLRGRGLSFVLP